MMMLVGMEIINQVQVIFMVGGVMQIINLDVVKIVVNVVLSYIIINDGIEVLLVYISIVNVNLNVIYSYLVKNIGNMLI